MIDINSLIKQALLAKDKIALNAYKNLKTELQKVLTAKNAPEYSEALFVQVTVKYAKSLEDAIKQFSEAHRDDLVAEYTSELEVLKKLLPEPVKAEDIYISLSNWCIENNFCSEIEEFIVMPETTKTFGRRILLPKKQMGTAIKHLKSKFPTADGKIISDIVKCYVI